MNAVDAITDRIVAAIESGDVEAWERPWRVLNSVGGQIRNGATGRPYNGINVWLLLLTMADHDYTDNRWYTYKQAKAAGAQVRKGEKGTQIVFFKPVKRKEKNEETGEVEEKKSLISRLYTVFNAAQIDGIEAETGRAMVFTPGRVQPVVDGLSRDGVVFGACPAGRAYYSRNHDRVMMPPIEDFDTEAAYDSTLLHECIHATGHDKRCAREFGKRFGDKAYAFEELVAELGSAFMGAELGLPYDGMQHPEYIKNWLDVIAGDRYTLLSAAKQAKLACEWLTENMTKTEESAA